MPLGTLTNRWVSDPSKLLPGFFMQKEPGTGGGNGSYIISTPNLVMGGPPLTAVPGERPFLANGKEYFQFDGVNDQMKCAVPISTERSVVFCVYRIPAPHITQSRGVYVLRHPDDTEHEHRQMAWVANVEQYDANLRYGFRQLPPSHIWESTLGNAWVHKEWIASAWLRAPGDQNTVMIHRDGTTQTSPVVVAPFSGWDGVQISGHLRLDGMFSIAPLRWGEMRTYEYPGDPPTLQEIETELLILAASWDHQFSCDC